MLAQVYDRQGKPDLAIEQFTQAIAVQPGMAALYRPAPQSSSGAETNAGGRERAIRDLEMAIRLEPPGSGFLCRRPDQSSSPVAPRAARKRGPLSG